MKRKLSPWGQRVKIEQIKRGWSNQQLADAAHLSNTYCAAVVYGRAISPRAAAAISDVLGIAAPENFSETSVT